jgi:outer membrane immunogenic protein
MKSLTRIFVGFCACNALALIALAGPESLPSGKEMIAPAPPPPGCTWTGFYVGITGGYTWSDSERVRTDSRNLDPLNGLVSEAAYNIAAAQLATFSLSTDNDGFMGGGQIGYNQQFGRWLVLGAEADMQGVFDSDDRTRADSSLTPTPGVPILQSAQVFREIDSIGTIRGRVGVTVMPCLLIYGTGGFAYGETIARTDITQLVTGSPFLPNSYHAHGQAEGLRSGWTAGGGLEWMFMTHWSIKAEYLFYDLGSESYQLSHLRNFSTALGGTLFTETAPVSHAASFDGNIVRGGLNFHF